MELELEDELVPDPELEPELEVSSEHSIDVIIIVKSQNLGLFLPKIAARHLPKDCPSVARGLILLTPPPVLLS